MVDRIFKISPNGEASIEPKPVDPVEASAEDPKDSGKARGASAKKKSDRLSDKALQEMSFSTHILSLNATALYEMGLLAEGDETPEVDFDSAAHVIDTLAMLKDKTKGNLTEAESRLLDQILYDLRIQYARLKK